MEVVIHAHEQTRPSLLYLIPSWYPTRSLHKHTHIQNHMAQTSPVHTQETCEHANITSVPFSNINIPMDSVLAVDEDIPTIDFLMLFSDDPIQQSKALDNLSNACDEYGFFYVCTLKTLFSRSIVIIDKIKE